MFYLLAKPYNPTFYPVSCTNWLSDTLKKPLFSYSRQLLLSWRVKVT